MHYLYTHFSQVNFSLNKIFFQMNSEDIELYLVTADFIIKNKVRCHMWQTRLERISFRFEISIIGGII